MIRTVLLTLLFLVAAAGSAYGGAYLGVARALPSLDLTSRLASPLTTKIFDASPTPVLLAEIHGLGARDVLPGDQIPQVMRDAIVAAEDPRFYEHKGMDFIAILHAAWANMRHHEVPAGGSAITQALIERAFAGDVEASQNATFQPVLAYELESRWTKEKILNEYLNVTHFGSGAYGLQAAAHSYFGVEAKDLTVAQAALLAGLPGAPATFSPRNDTEGAVVLRSQVLNKLYQQRYITSAQLQEALAAPLGLADGLTDIAAPAPLWVDLVREQLVARYGSSTVLQGGLRVYTSLDLTLQQAAEKAVTAVDGRTGGQTAIAADAIHDRLSAALVAIDVRTGSLVALVEGDGSAEQTNLAMRRRSPAGTAFSPFVLAAAAEQGMGPQATCGPATGSAMTLADALTHASTESLTALVSEIGASAVAKTAADLGITSPLNEDLSPNALLRGPSTGVAPLEMALAYATLCTAGERFSQLVTFDRSTKDALVSIVRVTDSDGRLLEENGSTRTRVLDRGLAEMVTSILRDGVTSGAGPAAGIGRPAAGQAGVSEDGRDAWFVGYTPELVTAVWVGYPGPDGSLVGSTLPEQIWAEFTMAALAGTPVSQFTTAAAEQWLTLDVCSETRLLPTELCPSVVKRLFRAGERPTDTCNVHVPQAVFMPNVVGMSLSKAKRTLTDVKLSVKTVTDTASLQPAGIVTKQDHAADKPILQGTVVVLHVSAGQSVKVPRLTELMAEAARTRLASAGLEAEITHVASDQVPRGMVVSQDPAAGTVVKRGSTVLLAVSSGPATFPRPFLLFRR